MQSTKRNSDLSAYVPAQTAAPRKSFTLDRSFAIACVLGVATTIFGFAALVHQFSAEFENFQNNSQGETSDFTLFS
jgi:hypothetical protein